MILGDFDVFLSVLACFGSFKSFHLHTITYTNPYTGMCPIWPKVTILGDFDVFLSVLACFHPLPADFRAHPVNHICTGSYTLTGPSVYLFGQHPANVSFGHVLVSMMVPMLLSVSYRNVSILVILACFRSLF